MNTFTESYGGPELVTAVEQKLAPFAEKFPEAEWVRGHHLFRNIGGYGGVYTPLLWLMHQGVVDLRTDELNTVILNGLPETDYMGPLKYYEQRRFRAFGSDDYAQDTIGQGRTEDIDLAVDNEANLFRSIFSGPADRDIIVEIFPFQDKTCNSCVVGKHCYDRKLAVELQPDELYDYHMNSDAGTLLQLQQALDDRGLGDAYEVLMSRPPSKTESSIYSVFEDLPQVTRFKLEDVRRVLIDHALEIYDRNQLFVEQFLERIGPNPNEKRQYSSDAIDSIGGRSGAQKYITGDGVEIGYEGGSMIRSEFVSGAWLGAVAADPFTNSYQITPSKDYVTVLVPFSNANALPRRSGSKIIPVGAPGVESNVLVQLEPGQKFNCGSYVVWYDTDGSQQVEVYTPEGKRADQVA